jgi:hypothetical protein
MNRFNRKTAIFYITTIVFVLVLFNIITAYGETKLKAPPSIAGSYKLQIEPQANCPNPEKLLLILQQSGIYLGATLLPDTPTTQTSVEYVKSFPLSGKLQEQQLKLVGRITNLAICRPSPAANNNSKLVNAPATVQIQGQFVGDSLQGQIILGSQAESINFTAESQPSS